MRTWVGLQRDCVKLPSFLLPFSALLGSFLHLGMATTKGYYRYIKALLTPYLGGIAVGGIDLKHCTVGFCVPTDIFYLDTGMASAAPVETPQSS